MRTNSLGLALRRTLTVLFLGGLPVFFLAYWLEPSGHGFGYDFYIFRSAGDAYLHGRSPYPAAQVAILAKQHSFVYPAPMAALFVPFALLPAHLGAIVFALLAAGCIYATLYLLDVRDPRVYGVVTLWLPVLNGSRLGTISPLLAFLVAGLWRYRDRPRTASFFLAAILVAKLFVWPLALWLLLTRRWRAAGAGAAIAAVVTLIAWAPIGFAGLGSYTHVLSVLAQAEQAQSFSVVALGIAAGLASHGAHAVAVLSAGLMLGLGLVLRLTRGRGAATDFGVFTLCVGAALAASPIVWNHYFVLLLVPVAIAAPSFGPIWLLPLALWMVPVQSNGGLARIAVAVAVPAAVLAWAVALHVRSVRRPGREGSERPERTTAGMARTLEGVASSIPSAGEGAPRGA